MILLHVPLFCSGPVPVAPPLLCPAGTDAAVSPPDPILCPQDRSRSLATASPANGPSGPRSKHLVCIVTLPRCGSMGGRSAPRGIAPSFLLVGIKPSWHHGRGSSHVRHFVVRSAGVEQENLVTKHHQPWRPQPQPPLPPPPPPPPPRHNRQPPRSRSTTCRSSSMTSRYMPPDQLEHHHIWLRYGLGK